VAVAFIGAGYFAPSAEACSPRLDGEPTYCPDWDTVILKEPKGITDKSFDEEFPDAFTHTVTLYDTRDDDQFNVAHMGHDFPTWPTAGEMIQAVREHESQKNRTSVEDMLNSSLAEYENGSNEPTEQEVLLQLPSNGD
jgi:hypothetical protein